MNREGARSAKEEKEGDALLHFAHFASSRFVQIIKKPYNFGVSKISCFDKIDRTPSNPISTSAKISPTVFSPLPSPGEVPSFSPPWQGGAGGLRNLAKT